MRILLPLHQHPDRDPVVWAVATGLDPDVAVVVNIADGPGRGEPDRAYLTATARLSSAGVPLLGYVDLAGAGRALATVLDDLRRWAAYPVSGVFLDRVPADRSHAGAVALVVRAARRSGLIDVVLHHGRWPGDDGDTGPTHGAAGTGPAPGASGPGAGLDPVQLGLGVQVCVFGADWADRVTPSRPDPAVTGPGAGVWVHGVPPSHVPLALDLLTRWRRLDPDPTAAEPVSVPMPVPVPDAVAARR